MARIPRRSWNSLRPTSASHPTTSTMKANGIAVAMKMDSIIRYPLFRPARPEVERVSRGIACLNCLSTRHRQRKAERQSGNWKSMNTGYPRNNRGQSLYVKIDPASGHNRSLSRIHYPTIIKAIKARRIATASDASHGSVICARSERRTRSKGVAAVGSGAIIWFAFKHFVSIERP